MFSLHIAAEIVSGKRSADDRSATAPSAQLEGLSVSTPEGTRRIVGGTDKSIRFYEAKDGKPTLPATAEQPDGVFREVAVFRMPEAVTNLQMTGDGRRLIIAMADGSARVWDIRDGAERVADLQREQAERRPAGQYLDTLWATDTPDEQLRDAVINDASLTPLRRLVAAELLEERLKDDRLAAEQAFIQLKKAVVLSASTAPAPAAGSPAGAGEATPADPAAIAAMLKAAMPARAATLVLPPRVKAQVVKMAAEWKPDANALNQFAWDMVKLPKAPAEGVAAALWAARAAVEVDPNNGAIVNTLGVALYRAGQFEEALAVLGRSTGVCPFFRAVA